MNVFTLDPLSDPRWDALVQAHPAASIFHTRGWLNALVRSYGFEPVVFTTSAPGLPLTNGIVTCRVRSWITGSRLVSVPFADHCDPLVADEDEREALSDALIHDGGGRWRYVELRPRGAWTHPPWQPAGSFVLHTLPLQPDTDPLFRSTHRDTIQRRIEHARRERLTCEEGRSAPLLDAFMHLMLLTRRRHGVPPAPRRWFENLLTSVGDDASIRVAFKGQTPIGSVLTIRHRDTLTYKYGCSDARFHHLGTMPFLLWQVVASAAHAGLKAVDLGRSDLDNPGLIRFKERWGAEARRLTYVRQSATPFRRQNRAEALSRLLPYLPDAVVVAAGRLLYPHLA